MLGNLFMLFPSADFFSKLLFFKKISRTLSVSNSLDPDQDRHSVGPDLGPSSLQRLLADAASKKGNT